MWIKICGNTNAADALHAAKSGASALGFVFAPSPRRVTPQEVGAIAARLPHNVERYGVFVKAEFAEIVAAVAEAKLTGVQLHVNDDPELPARLRAHFDEQPAPVHLGIVSVLHYSADLDRQLDQLIRKPETDAVLVDSRTPHSVGGTGVRFDWKDAQQIFQRYASQLRLIVAGGLNPDNVEQALITLEAWGVDVASGVEAEPGRKDPALVSAFIQNARRACAQLEYWRAQGSVRS